MSHRLAIGFSKALTLIVLGLFTTAALAQSTTSSIRGKLLDTSGNPVSNAEVVVTDQRTGSTRRVSSNDSGTFFASNLVVGGPYKVSINGSKTVEVENIALGDIYQLNIDDLPVAGAAASTMEEVVVTGKSLGLEDVASGPSAVFSLYDLETAVAFDRDIKDVFSNDPRINLDDSSRGAGVNCAGKNPRFNGISIDGVSQNDRFGLNSNGYATANGQPFPFDAISQVSVELAPFDVTYGGFSACAINAVTKSGSNEWFGNAFYEYSSDSFRGDRIDVDGQQIDVGGGQDYTEETLGFTLGGPVIKDKLFFFLSYEQEESPRFTAQGYNGSGNGSERDWLSEADYSRILNAAQSIYGYDPGGQPGEGLNDVDKLLARLDWDINDQHRMSLIYNQFEGFEDRASDGDSYEFEFSNHFYRKGSDLSTTVLKLNSQWTDTLSTELFIGRNELEDSQVTVGDPDFADFQISINRDVVYLGADDSRQANALNYSSDLIKFNLQYLAGDHVITAGFEQDELDVFNQFVQHSRGGEYDFFDDSFDGGLSGIEKFEQGLPDRIYYGSAGGSNDANDAAASFTTTKRSLFIQDEYFFDDLGLTVVGGLRYEKFSIDDRPVFNPAFTAANGVANNANIDGVDLLMPRLGFTWDLTDTTTLRGGVGVFAGGNPNVWISNSYSNDGITNVQLQRSFDDSIFNLPLSGAGRPGFDVPQSMVDEVANTSVDSAATSNLALVDPNYEQPNELKFAIGATFDVSDELSIDTDLLYSKQRDSAVYVDLSQDVVGRTQYGAPIYASVRGSDNYMLTNSSNDANSYTLSVALRQAFESGAELSLGYAYSEAEDVAGMNSSVAGSNFDGVATSNPNNVEAGISEYNTQHRLTMKFNTEKNFFGNLNTRFSVYGVLKEGQGTSYTMSNTGLEDNGFGNRQLLYVPRTNDTAVLYGEGFDRASFDAFIASEGLARGQFVGRNEADSKASARLDLRIDQELPSIGGFEPRLYLKVNNLLNMLNNSWGAQYDAQFVSEQAVETSVNSDGQLVFERFADPSTSVLIEDFSVWEARVGIEVKF
ncbi:TonB-dependent receptor [Arenicella xantha]|uniref:TonB-dependent receptor-like protein n=1 Tax=Arenicella xantha TaxID=644221 RepID=A0A395JNY0_9GAMM|nr:TonB-dependent receptor [Arenicella xantha]RBP53361.1 TonB-dependent receptor-like protein [Arenicella xantha]